MPPVDQIRVESEQLRAGQYSTPFKEVFLGWVSLLLQGGSPSFSMENFEPRFGSASARDSREKIPAWRRVVDLMTCKVYFSSELRWFFDLMKSCFPIKRYMHTRTLYKGREQLDNFHWIKNTHLFFYSKCAIWNYVPPLTKRGRRTTVWHNRLSFFVL